MTVLALLAGVTTGWLMRQGWEEVAFQMERRAAEREIHETEFHHDPTPVDTGWGDDC